MSRHGLLTFLATLFGASAAAAQIAPFTTINVGSTPLVATADTSNGKVFVLNFNSRSVSVIDATTWTKTVDIPTGWFPRAAAFNPFTRRLYLTWTRTRSP